MNPIHTELAMSLHPLLAWSLMAVLLAGGAAALAFRAAEKARGPWSRDVGVARPSVRLEAKGIAERAFFSEDPNRTLPATPLSVVRREVRAFGAPTKMSGAMLGDDGQWWPIPQPQRAELETELDRICNEPLNARIVRA